MRNKKQIEKDKAITLIEKYIIELEADNAKLKEILKLVRPIIYEGLDEYWDETHSDQVMQARAALKGADDCGNAKN